MHYTILVAQWWYMKGLYIKYQWLTEKCLPHNTIPFDQFGVRFE